jgi:hypothetical protein
VEVMMTMTTVEMTNMMRMVVMNQLEDGRSKNMNFSYKR